MVTKSITLLAPGEPPSSPLPNIPRVEFPTPCKNLLATVRSPKSVVFDVVVMVTKSIVLSFVGV